MRYFPRLNGVAHDESTKRLPQNPDQAMLFNEAGPVRVDLMVGT
jgi:hypothetical protein